MKIRTFILSICLVSIANAQTWVWDYVSNHNGRIRFHKDAAKNIYHFGQFEIRKLNAQGQVLMQVSLPVGMEIKSLVTAPDLSFFVCGRIIQGSYTVSGVPVATKGLDDIWVAHYNASGVLQWLQAIGGPGDDTPGELCYNNGRIILTGGVSDSLSVFGQTYHKPPGCHLFVARVTTGGQLLSITFAQSSLVSSQFHSSGIECTSDASGNVYFIGEINHASTLNNVSIGSSNRLSVFKTDSLLNVSWVYTLPGSNYPHYLTSLHHSPSGATYFIENNNGLGNNEWTIIRRLDQFGTATSTYTNLPGLQGRYWDLDLDSCENVYFTGYQHTPAGPNQIFYLVNGQLTPFLKQNWMRADSGTTYRVGGAIKALNINDCIVGGGFNDSIQLGNLHYQFPLVPAYGFFGNLRTIPLAPVSTTTSQLLCFGQAVTLTVSSTAPVSWYGDPVTNTILHTGNTFTLPPQPPGVYSYFAGASTCNTITPRSPLNFTVVPLPVVTVNNGVICSGEVFNLTASGGITYTYSSGAATVIPVANTIYTVTGADNFGCRSTATTQVSVIDCVSIDEIMPDLFSVFPNPNAGQFNIQSMQKDILSLHDITGRKIYELPVKDGHNTFELYLPKGLYIIRSMQTRGVLKIVID